MTTYGQNLRLSIYGGSHDPEIGVHTTGLPVGESISEEELLAFIEKKHQEGEFAVFEM